MYYHENFYANYFYFLIYGIYTDAGRMEGTFYLLETTPEGFMLLRTPPKPALPETLLQFSTLLLATQ